MERISMSTENNEKKVIKNKKKIAFVASGGAIKAACFHIGVMLAMERFGFSFLGGLKETEEEQEVKPGQVGIYVGSSAGSFVASLIAGGYKPVDLYNSLSENYNSKKSILRPIFYGDIVGNNIISNVTSTINSLLRTRKYKNFSIEGFIQTLFGINGLFNTGNVGRYLKSAMPSDNFTELLAELYIVTTELDNPNRIILGPREIKSSRHATFATDVKISDAAIGSMSLPVIFGPHKLKINGRDRYVFDGEIRHTLSTHIAKDAGADLIIASYTHQPYNYNPDYGSLINYGLPAIIVQTIYQLVESKIKESKEKHMLKEDAIDEVRNFFIEKDLPKDLMNEMVEKLHKRLEYEPNLDYIYISPEPDDSRMFFEDHFNLSLKSMGKIIRSGFKSAYHTFRQYEFDFSSNSPVFVEFRNKNSDNLFAQK
jgi:predicted acylesterase/phospholipase RssA